jgi:hypothetical protein
MANELQEKKDQKVKTREILSWVPYAKRAGSLTDVGKLISIQLML